MFQYISIYFSFNKIMNVRHRFSVNLSCVLSFCLSFILSFPPASLYSSSLLYYLDNLIHDNKLECLKNHAFGEEYSINVLIINKITTKL